MRAMNRNAGNGENSMRTVESKFDFSDFVEEGFKKTKALEKGIYIFRDGFLWSGFSEGGSNIRDIDHGVIEAFLKDTSVDRYHLDFRSMVLEEFVQIVPETKMVLALANSYYSPEQLQTIQELVDLGYTQELLESTLLDREDVQQRNSIDKIEDFSENQLNYLEHTVSTYLNEQIDADMEVDTFSDPSAYSNREAGGYLLTKEEMEQADSWLSREVSSDNVMQLLEIRENIRSEQAYLEVKRVGNEDLARSEELFDKDMDKAVAAFKEDTSKNLVDDHKSSLEQELTEAIASGDLKRIAEKRAELNQQKMEQLIKQNHQLEKQAIQAKEAAQLAKKEQAIDVYEDYLTKGKLSNEQLETLVSLDKELSAFDKVNVRLEAIERVKSANSGISLDNYEALLESIRADAGLLNELLDVEYYQMSTGSQTSTKQSLLSENSIELAIE